MTEHTKRKQSAVSPAPKHLSEPTRAWWAEVMKVYQLEPHHIKLLTLACEALDRAGQARAVLEREGTYFRNRFGEPRVHPASNVERDARIAFARLLRELQLDVAADLPRPPGLTGVRNHAR